MDKSTMIGIGVLSGLVLWSISKSKSSQGAIDTSQTASQQAASGSISAGYGQQTGTSSQNGEETVTPPIEYSPIPAPSSGSVTSGLTTPPTGTPVTVPPGTPVVPINYTVTVIDMSTQKPIPGALVTVQGMAGVTDSNGKAVFNNVPASNSTEVDISATGYQPVIITRSFGITAPNPTSTVALPELTVAPISITIPIPTLTPAPTTYIPPVTNVSGGSTTATYGTVPTPYPTTTDSSNPYAVLPFL